MHELRHTQTHTHTDTHTHTHRQTHTHTHTPARTHTHTHANARTHKAQARCAYWFYARVYVHTAKHKALHMLIGICIHKEVFCAYIYIYTHIYTYKHAYIRTTTAQHGRARHGTAWQDQTVHAHITLHCIALSRIAYIHISIHPSIHPSIHACTPICLNRMLSFSVS